MLTLIAPAKINLYLEIVGDRPDGFHELVMILQSIALSDRLTFDFSDSASHQLVCDHAELGDDPTQNLVYKAATLMAKVFPTAFSKYGGVTVHLEKNIPIAAGLAGGSADAAATLVGINLLWHLGLTQPELEELAAQLGSDIPFCVAGGTAIATGRGEKLDFIKNPPSLWVVLAKHRKLAVSTPWAYKTYRQQFGETYLNDPAQVRSRAARLHSGPLVNAITKGDRAELAAHLYNDLEKVVLPAHAQVQQLRDAFGTSGAIATMMSGSGPTVFGLCESELQAQEVKRVVAAQMHDPNLGFWITRLTSQGIHLAL
ncbi:MAG: 4-(cytidine 5'-diphospho)-2-C-methyl-D-erythritol kinase [Spirulina sp. SIO3F2]|nr:4-(cytidine 5'-diphospho)-2-C-methyl-D-erythritol kinase [Spirulina sp. SIO3F2]